jgi:acetyltransferase-like isoleucine patch superfamily enzyme
VGGAPNAHRYWYTVRDQRNGIILGPLRIALNYGVIYAAKHCPSLMLKRWLFRWLGMKLGKNVTIASGVTMDYFFPELIEIGDNTIIGMDTMILTHEFLHDRWRCGKVTIGQNVLVGAQSTILAGVTVGNNAVISAMSLVNRRVPDGAFVGGVPIRAL